MLTLPEKPAKATHVLWRNKNIEIIEPAHFAHDFLKFNEGEIVFGKYSPAIDTFTPLTPMKEDEGQCRVRPENLQGMQRELASEAEPQMATSAKGKAAKPEKAAKAKRAKVTASLPGSIARPATGTKTGQVWDACDALLKQLGVCPTKPQIAGKLEKGFSISTISVQFGKWKKANAL